VPARQPAETRDTDIEYKGHDTGIEVQLVNKYDTSQTYNRCAREGVRATQEGV
jgi:transposase